MSRLKFYSPPNLVVESKHIGESEIMCIIKPEEEGGQGGLGKFNSHLAELPDSFCHLHDDISVLVMINR